MASSILQLFGGMSLGFYLTYTVSNHTHSIFRKNIYLPIKEEIKKEEDDYWTRVYDTLSEGVKKSYQEISDERKQTKKKK